MQPGSSPAHVLTRAQTDLMGMLREIATQTKAKPGPERKAYAAEHLRQLNKSIAAPVHLPLHPGFVVRGLDVDSCLVYNSNAAPMRLTFGIHDSRGHIDVLYKVGDDLRQDMLALQLIRIMDKLWRHEGLDFRMTTFLCLPTGADEGLVEIVEAETMREIQAKMAGSVSGALNSRVLHEWLKIANPESAAFERATRNFMLSCAGYCVATYVLGAFAEHCCCYSHVIGRGAGQAQRQHDADQARPLLPHRLRQVLWRRPEVWQHQARPRAVCADQRHGLCDQPWRDANAPLPGWF